MKVRVYSFWKWLIITVFSFMVFYYSCDRGIYIDNFKEDIQKEIDLFY